MKLHSSINVLLLGGGGREHAFAWKMSQSERVAQVFIAPGNAGTAQCGTNVELSLTNFAGIKQFILSKNINLVVVGPEGPLVQGITDFLMNDDQIHVPVIGPTKAGARLEGSKEFAKAFMARHAIPTARYKSVTIESIEQGYDFLEQMAAPYVLKADGLAAGKGVVIVGELDDARRELKQMLDGKFGAASDTVVIEEFLEGTECSIFVATDGVNYKILPAAKDYKRVGDGDTGLNTGGMGAVSPVPFVDEHMIESIRRSIIEPTIKGLEAEKITYRGFLFIGIMSVRGVPYVIEYNVRMGDPESQAVLPLIESDIIGLFEGIAYGSLDRYELRTSSQSAVAVVCVAGGYPDSDFRRGDKISGLDTASESESIIFHSGTETKAGEIYTCGGRILTVTSLGDSVQEAIGMSYRTIDKISYSDKQYRTDIGQDLL